MGIKRLVKKIITIQTHIMTWELNMCQKFICTKKHTDLIRRQHIKKVKSTKLNEYQKYYRQFKMKAPCIDYYFFAPFLSEYGKDPARIIPESLVQNRVNPILNPIEYRAYYQDKNNFERILPPETLPETVLRKIRGKYYTKDYQLIENLNDEQLLKYVSTFKNIIVKPSVDSSSGHGVNLFISQNGHFKHIYGSKELSVAYLEKNYGDDIIIQKCMNQSPYLSLFNPTSINTIRVCIYRSVKDDDIKVLWHILRIGKNGSFVDNAHAGGVFIGINQDGKLDNHLLNQYGDKFSIYNDIDFSKNTYSIPNWNKVIEFSKSIGRSILHHRLIQLDVMLDTNNDPYLIEYNINAPGVWVALFTGQYVLADYSDEILEYCMRHKEKGKKTIFIPA